MKFNHLVVFVFIFALVGNVFSQELSKAEKKTLKKEIKTLLKDPAKYKMQKESLAAKELIVQEQTTELLSLTNENAKNLNRLNLAKDSISLFTTKISEIEEEYSTLKSSGGIDNTGMKFKLQIGKYKEFDITSFLNEKKIMSFEQDEDGNFVYSIGNFDTEYDAELFKSAIRQIGIRDAFVAYYLDGNRVPKD